MQIDVYRRMDGDWMLESYAIGDAVVFESIGFTIPIEEIAPTWLDCRRERASPSARAWGIPPFCFYSLRMSYNSLK